MNVVLIGEEAAGMRTLQSLHQCGVRVVAVMASPRQQDGVELRPQVRAFCRLLCYDLFLHGRLCDLESSGVEGMRS